MAIPLASIPRFAPAEALAVAEREYGIVGDLSALPSERDQNFLIERPGGGGKVVLKIANRDDAPELLEFQHQAMRRLAMQPCGCGVQQLVPTRAGADVCEIRDAAGTRHCVRVLTWIEGEVLAECKRPGAALFASIGTCMARIDVALEGFAHPAMHRVLQWDLRRASLARSHAALLGAERRSSVERAFEEWQGIDWSLLRHGVIHGDANDHNVLIEDARMSGLLDFGDMVYSATVCELAIALAYAMFHAPDPLAAARPLIRGYHRHNPLSASEQRVLFTLVRARLAMSVCYSAHNRARNPQDAYQVVSEEAAFALLGRLESCSPDAQRAAVREACD